MELNHAHIAAGPAVSQDVLHPADERAFAASEQPCSLSHSLRILAHQLRYPLSAYSFPIGFSAASHSVLHQFQNPFSSRTQPSKFALVHLQHFAKIGGLEKR